MVNFSFYKALECLHGAKRDVTNQSPPARDWAEIMLDEGLRALWSPRAASSHAEN